MAEPINLNELLVKMYQRRIVRALYDDPTLPWLPESFWREDYEKKVQGQTYDLMQLIDEARVERAKADERQRIRDWQDDQLANASVEDLAAEWDRELPKLQGTDPRMLNEGWGTRSMADIRWRHAQAPTPGSHQPEYHFECFQCGRPITADGRDHAGKRLCDLTLVDQVDIDTQSYWTDHQAKPWHGEDEDDGEETDDQQV